jgi:hypothetical protein
MLGFSLSPLLGVNLIPTIKTRAARGIIPKSPLSLAGFCALRLCVWYRTDAGKIAALFCGTGLL